MGMQSASMQSPYSSAPQGKGQGLPNPDAQMSPNQPTENIRDQMMRRFPQNSGIMKPQDMMQTGGFKGPMGDGSVQSTGPLGEMTGGMPMGQVYRGEMTGGNPMVDPMPYGNTGVVGPNQNTGPFYHPPMGGGQTDPNQVPRRSSAPTDGSVGKGQGSQGTVTFPGQGGQPKIGQANPYPNTINPSDNTGMSQPSSNGGKSKGAR